MKDLETMYTDAICYESEMRYLTDLKLLWVGIVKANLAYRRLRKYMYAKIRKVARRLLNLLWKILKRLSG